MTHEVFAHLILICDYGREFRNKYDRMNGSLTITLGVCRGEASPYPVELSWTDRDARLIMIHSPTGWSIHMVSAKVFQLRGLVTHEPLLVT